MEKLRNDSINIINSIDTSFIRDFANTIDWKDRLIGIKGARGVGKTTLLLQYIKRNLPISQSLYVSLDNIYFSSNILVDLADEFVKTGGEYLILDEVHRYSNWSIEIKNIYDTHKNLKVIFTGSSILHIDHRKADLSRRVVFYEMPGFSLREYVNIKTDNAFEAVSFEDILIDHQQLSMNITENIKPIALYNDYNRIGYYPFFLENEATYHKKIEEIINVVMEIDIPQSFEISLQSIEKMKKLLYIISSSTPFKPNIVKLSEKIGATRNTIKT
ncbi:MAG: AAA family ATPase, partial [Bacteroidetes bacterium]|nr:AAA family ATPase [Bacteroidota bacterium]